MSVVSRTARGTSSSGGSRRTRRRSASSLPADLVFTNHVLLGGPVGVASGAPFAVKAHGSELEYAMRGRADLVGVGRRRLSPRPGRRSSARSTSARSSRTSAATRSASSRCRPASTSTSGSPRRVTSPARDSSTRLAATGRTPGTRRSGSPTTGTRERLEAFLTGDEPTVVYFGKLIEQKGVHVLIDAMRGVDARLVVVGFGPERTALERQAAAGGVRALFTGPLEHRHLRHLLAFADACVVPSVFPEAFGMVAAEAAATGCPPIVARHSGLAEVAAGLEAELPPQLARLVSTPTGDVSALRERLEELFALPASDRAQLRETVRRAVEERWSWAGVARRLLESSL